MSSQATQNFDDEWRVPVIKFDPLELSTWRLFLWTTSVFLFALTTAHFGLFSCYLLADKMSSVFGEDKSDDFDWTDSAPPLFSTCYMAYILISSYLTGLIFARLSRGSKRGENLLFTQFACLKNIESGVALQLKLYDNLSSLNPLNQISVSAITVSQYGMVKELSLVSGPLVDNSDYHAVRDHGHENLCLPRTFSHIIDTQSPLRPFFEADGFNDSRLDSNENDGSNMRGFDSYDVKKFLLTRKIGLIISVEAWEKNSNRPVYARKVFYADQILDDKKFAPSLFIENNRITFNPLLFSSVYK